MIEKLQKVGLLITLVCTIGGGFYTWGTFNQRLDVIEDKKFVINQEVDLTEVYRIIEELRGDVKINQAALDYFEARLNEFKTEQSNPLLN
jgi:nitrate/TMAO reductase-like tetraheme cytochrome c subunit|tara:strand:- start:289 stop:558 length:270 start_codon:yes stop_codon:yes gene_type:complete